MSEVVFKPGRNFSAIHITLPDDSTPLDNTEAAILVWTRLSEQYPEPEYAAPPAEGAAPAGNGRAAAPQRASGGSGVWCQEHRAECTQSPRKMQGGEYDVFMHKYPQGQTGPQGGAYHTVYFRETVDVNGESNDGRELPATVTQPPVDAQPQRDGDDPGPSEPNF